MSISVAVPVNTYDKDESPEGDIELVEGSKADDDPIAEEGSAADQRNMKSINGNFHSFWESVVRAEGPATTIVLQEDYAKSMGVFSPLAGLAAWIDNLYRITDRGSSFYHEFTGGMTTFFSMAYIMVLNGVIIGGKWPIGTGISTNAVFFATTLSAGIFTFLMGSFVNIPVALAPGMGLNGYFATVSKSCVDNKTGSIDGIACPGWGESSLPWSDAMGAVLVSGLFYLLLTVTGLRAMLFVAIPKSMRAGITAGIGFFITIIGLTIGQITRVTLANWGLAYHVYPAGECDSYGCANAVDINFQQYSLGMARFGFIPEARIAVLGLVFVSMFEVLKVKGSIIISIILATFVGINYYNCGKSVDMDNTCVTDLTNFSQEGGATYIVDTNDIPSGKLTFKYAKNGIYWEAVFTFLFVEMFDSFGTLSGIMERCGFLKGDPQLAMTRVNRGMCVDGLGLVFGALIGSNSITCYVESNTGVEAGARTGVASMITGAAFLLSLLFVQPFVGIIPDAATTCALVMVGVHSISALKDVNFEDFTDQLTAFFTIATMGFTYSIANGIAVAFIFYTWMRTVQFIHGHIMKKLYPDGSEKITDLPHPILYGGAVFAVLRFAYLGDFARDTGVGFSR